MRRAAAFACSLLLIAACTSDDSTSDDSSDAGGSGTTEAAAETSLAAPATDAPTSTAAATTTTTTEPAQQYAATIDELLAIGRPIVLAHTAGEDEFPASTMYGFGESVKAGVDMLDMNVQLTKDGVLIVHHDDTLDRATNGVGAVADFTYAELAHQDGNRAAAAVAFAQQSVVALDHAPVAIGLYRPRAERDVDRLAAAQAGRQLACRRLADHFNERRPGVARLGLRNAQLLPAEGMHQRHRVAMPDEADDLLDDDGQRHVSLQPPACGESGSFARAHSTRRRAARR